MILCIDSGNTRVKFAYFAERNDSPLAYATLAKSELLQGTDLATIIFQLNQQLKQQSPEFFNSSAAKISKIIIANVAGSAVAAILRAHLIELFSEAVPIIFLSAQKQQCGVINCYVAAENLGVDRWCAMLAVHNNAALNGYDKLIVSLGTALTLDYIRADGHFVGGQIAPGIELMRQSLAQNTAQLYYGNGHLTEFATNTADAIYSGCFDAALALIEKKYANILTKKYCIISGGDAPEIQQKLTFTTQIFNHLVLQGINLIAQ